MYRLIAKPFLEANLAVAIVGYRTYPDGSIQSQVNDLEAASKEIALNYPTLCSKPLALAKNEWTGTILLGHSSGAHIAILKLAQQIERWSKIKDVNSKELGINFDQVIGLSGVYSINEHFDLESGRGVEEISPMKPGCGYTMDSFDLHSPAVRLAAMSTKRSKYLKLPDMLLIHGVNDDVVPFSSAKRAANILQNWGYDNVETHYLKSTGHQDTIMHLMFGGVARDFIFSKILQLKPRDI
jgi:acetyl esterase/lipase